MPLRSRRASYEPITLPDESTLKNKPPEAFGAEAGVLVVAGRSFRSRTGGALLATARGLPQVAPGNLVALLLGPLRLNICYKSHENLQKNKRNSAIPKIQGKIAEFCVENLRITASR